LYGRWPESGVLWYNSRQLKKLIWPHSEGWWVQATLIHCNLAVIDAIRQPSERDQIASFLAID
jgi:hypothetical protein